MAQKIVAGNWKMNLVPKEGLALIDSVAAYLHDNGSGDVKVIMAPPMAYLSEAASHAAGKGIEIAAQNCHDRDSGAYTGEVSVPMLNSMGVQWAILGHSERREYFQEGGEFLNRKLVACLNGGVKPILCVGELIEDRRAGAQQEVVGRQLNEALKDIPASDLEDLVVAYEPVWAIGTGETASPAQAQEMHAFIRGYFADKYGEQIATSISILYGGSVKPDNAAEIFSQTDVDGGLIGGASLNAVSFEALIDIGKQSL